MAILSTISVVELTISKYWVVRWPGNVWVGCIIAHLSPGRRTDPSKKPPRRNSWRKYEDSARFGYRTMITSNAFCRLIKDPWSISSIILFHSPTYFPFIGMVLSIMSSMPWVRRSFNRLFLSETIFLMADIRSPAVGSERTPVKELFGSKGATVCTHTTNLYTIMKNRNVEQHNKLITENALNDIMVCLE